MRGEVRGVCCRTPMQRGPCGWQPGAEPQLTKEFIFAYVHGVFLKLS